MDIFWKCDAFDDCGDLSDEPRSCSESLGYCWYYGDCLPVVFPQHCSHLQAILIYICKFHSSNWGQGVVWFP